MKESKYWFVYIILTVKDRLYTGITTDVERRFNEHKSDTKKGAKFFRSDSPSKIIYIGTCSNRSVASKLEAAIKKLTRPQKENFIKEQTSGRNKIYGRRKKESSKLDGSSRAFEKRKS